MSLVSPYGFAVRALPPCAACNDGMHASHQLAGPQHDASHDATAYADALGVLM